MPPGNYFQTCEKPLRKNNRRVLLLVAVRQHWVEQYIVRGLPALHRVDAGHR